MRYLISIGVVAAFGFLVILYGNARESAGYERALKIQANTDARALSVWAEQQRIIQNQVLNGISELNQIKDNPVAGPNVQRAFDILRNLPKPSAKPSNASDTARSSN